MQQLMSQWQALDLRRRILLAGGIAAFIATLVALASVAMQPSLALLYAGLDGARAGEVLAALDRQGAAYEVRGDAIYVESARRDPLRMALAAEGLPAESAAGYELLDSLSGFGTTSQMFDAAYWRAKEGELARTIAAMPAVRSARVHIAAPSAQGLLSQPHPSASITVATTGGGLSPVHAKALKFLVASAVAGMTPDDVSVIDSSGGLIEAGDPATGNGGHDRAADLKQAVERLLEARVGYGNAVVEVSVETVTERESITERRIDPETRVAISTDTEERSTSSSDSTPGAVTVASNLPQGDAAAGEGRSQSQNSETRERTNFEISETTRELLRSPGATRRLSVAVLVDGIESVDTSGNRSWAPREEAELTSLRDLVAAAVGLDEARGDVLTLRSMPFEPIVADAAAPASALLFLGGLDLGALIRVSVLGLVALVLGLFVLRPLLVRRPVLPALPPRTSAGAPERVLTGEIDDRDFDADGLPVAGAGRRVPALPDPDADPVARLRKLIAERQGETVEILRGWMEDPEEERL